MTYGVSLSALSDPTRRALFERLMKQPYTVGELTRFAGISQPAVSQHLRVLRQAGLVSQRPDGTRHYYQANREGLADLRRYVEGFWDDALAAYAAGDPMQRRTDDNSDAKEGR